MAVHNNQSAYRTVEDSSSGSDRAHWRVSRWRRRVGGWLLIGLSGLSLVSALAILGWILGYVLLQGGQQLSLGLLTQLPPAAGQTGGGIGNALLGTVILVAIATLMAVPVGLMAALYLSEFCTRDWVRQGVRVLTD